MIARLFLAAIAAGLIAGVLVTGLQMTKVIPLIHGAEVFETAAPAAPTEGHAHDDAEAGDLMRTTLTGVSNIITGAGFGLLLAAGMAFRGRSVDWQRGMLWGVCGFFTFSLAPAFGLPPELPGMAAAELGARQMWWLMAVAGTGAGIALICLASSWPLRLAGILAIVLPHTFSAPHVDWMTNAVPPEMAAQYVGASLATAAVFWVVLGALTGHFLGHGTTEREA